MNIVKSFKLMCVFLMGMLLMVMVPQVAFATDGASDPNGGTGDFSERFEMEGGKLKDSAKEKNSTNNTFNLIFEKYRGVIAGVSGIVAISMMLLFIIQAFRLGSSAHNASERQKATQGLIWLGIATAISGSVSLFTGLFYGMLT